MTARSGAAAWLPLVAAIAWLAASGWIRPLMLPDEGRYVGVAWEMLRSGQWLTPTLDALPYFHKPPLFYWLTAASLALFGMNEWAGRLASLLGAAAGAVALFVFARHWGGPRTASLALVALVTQPLVYFAAQFANLDMLVAGCIGVSILAFAHAALLDPAAASRRPALLLAYGFAALAVLAKGLIGLVLPGMVLLAWLLLLGRPRALTRLLWLPGIVLFLAVAGPWFVAMQLRYDQFAHYFVVVQHFSRFSGTGFNNAQPWWFFPALLALLALPWSAWLAWAARAAYWSDPVRGPVRKLMWLWLLLVTLFFSLPQSKLAGYILPATLPLAFLAGDAADVLWLRARRWWQLSAALGAAACLAAIGVVASHPQNSTRELARLLASRMAPGDPVIFLQEYYFDVAFYARLRDPVLVVDDWADPEVAQRDNWHRELSDAGRFAPATAQRVLLLPEAGLEIACAAATSWLLGPMTLVRRYPLLEGLPIVHTSGGTALWQLRGRPAGALNSAACQGKPSVSQEGRS
ncbi:MAG: glycosyltransferase family 39 protein [Ramlibacter sp.]|nr:glycosyltransferase family 39 protein [Ramlibacter sp.]